MSLSTPRPRAGVAAFLAFALLALLPLTIAPAGFAQSPGDEQYADPIGGGGGEQPEPQPDPDSGAETDAPAVAPPAESPSTVAPTADSPAATAPETATLPRTGVEAWWLAAIGVALLAAGAVGRSRTGSHVRP